MEQFIMNNCKIANELRKYRDMTGCVNRAGLSDDPENYVECVITRELSYMDMVTANAVYSLWRSGEGDNGFRAETIGQIMAGDMDRRLRPEKQDEIEERLQRLAGTELYILADHDQQAMQEVYEGAFLPLVWETGCEYGLLWVLGLMAEGKNPAAEAKRIQQTLEQLLGNWRKSGYVTENQYQFLPEEKGYGVLLLSGDKTEKKRNKKEKK